MLTDTAPDTTRGQHLDAILDIKPNRCYPDWATVHAIPTLNPLCTQTRIVVYYCQADLNLIYGERLKRAAGADLHTCEGVADNARLGVRINVRRSGKV